MRKRDETRRENMLACARAIMANEGAEAINIRRIAKESGIATGTVYNYFSDKDDILLALTEEYWRSALMELHAAVECESFVTQVSETYRFLRIRITDSARALMASLQNVQPAGRARMGMMQAVLQGNIIKRIDMDKNTDSTIWTDQFTKGDFAAFVLSNLMQYLRADVEDIGFFLELLTRTLY